MPKTAALEKPSLSPCTVITDMLERILGDSEMDVDVKLAELRELCIERISFDSPERAVRIISLLARIIASASNPAVRIAALEAMERMIALEEKAELEQRKPAIDWLKVNVLLRKAKKQTEQDLLATPGPDPMAPEPALVAREEEGGANPANPKGSDNITPEEAALLAAQEKAVAAIQQAHIPVVPPSPEMLAAGPESAPKLAAQRPQPQNAEIPVTEEKTETVVNFLRSIADTDDEENLRVLANRLIAKIENLTAQQSSSPPPPALTEG